MLPNARYIAGGESYIAQILERPNADVLDLCMIIIHVLPAAELRDEEPHATVPLESSEYVRALESELLETKNNLQLAAGRSRKPPTRSWLSSNEELLSANEELQSSE